MSFAPIRHFTDHKIRVHLFTCVLALALAHLMRREAAQTGLSLSVPAMVAETRRHRRDDPRPRQIRPHR